jgi:hypothetical protein
LKKNDKLFIFFHLLRGVVLATVETQGISYSPSFWPVNPSTLQISDIGKQEEFKPPQRRKERKVNLIKVLCFYYLQSLRTLRLCLPREMCNLFNWGGEK